MIGQCGNGQLRALSIHAALILGLFVVAPGVSKAGDGSRLYAPCVVCHAPQGWGALDGSIPSLAGQQQRYLEKQIDVFESGARIDSAMQLVAEHPHFGSHQDVVDVSRYLSALQANPNPVKGPGKNLIAAMETYEHICAACHGFDGNGNSANRVPRIAGQQYPYLARRIRQAAQLHMNLAPPEMAGALRGMGEGEKDALADYLARAGNPAVPDSGLR